MTLKQAQQMDCPYKPRSVDLLTGQSLSKCTGSPCMCWVDTSIHTHKHTKHLGGIKEIDIEDFLKTNPEYETIEKRYSWEHRRGQYDSYIVGIPYLLKQGYCTLRGDI